LLVHPYQYSEFEFLGSRFGEEISPGWLGMVGNLLDSVRSQEVVDQETYECLSLGLARNAKEVQLRKAATLYYHC
jgi:hypothetical protein